MDYQICLRCVMDTSDKSIVFDSGGVCSHCASAENLNRLVKNNIANNPINDVLTRVKIEGMSQKYDCIIGLSGGVDSSYVALKAVRAGLRPLAVHVDGGWNTEVAVANIKAVVDALDLPLFTKVINWKEMCELQKAYLKSGIANQDVPQDHAFFATLYQVATSNSIRVVITGSNLATESILPTSWEYDAMDGRNLKSIAHAHGCRLPTYPVLRLPRYYVEHLLLRRMAVVKPLNHMEYVRESAIEQLKSEFGWQDYGGKHRESAFTDWFQHSYLLRRFGIDKRRAHASSLIASGQFNRQAALAQISRPPLDERDENRLQAFVCRKLGISDDELRDWIGQPERPYSDFRNDEMLIKRLSALRPTKALRRLVKA